MKNMFFPRIARQILKLSIILIVLYWAQVGAVHMLGKSKAITVEMSIAIACMGSFILLFHGPLSLKGEPCGGEEKLKWNDAEWIVDELSVVLLSILLAPIGLLAQIWRKCIRPVR